MKTVICCYILFVSKKTAEFNDGEIMKLIINSTSMVPIYEQITESIRRMIANGELKAGDALPSVRVLAKEQKISALTVKKAYDRLEEEGLTATVHGKGTYVTGSNKEMIAEMQRREIEDDMEKIVAKARNNGVNDEELREILELLLGE